MDLGVVVRYDAKKGFGFVRSPAFGSSDVFVHATAIVGRGPLRPGQHVRFTAEATEKGPRATRVEPGRQGLSPAMLAFSSLAIILIAGTGGLAYYARFPLIVAWLCSINVVSFIVYAWDKRQAKIEGRRVPEFGLLGLALIGGWFGAIGAMVAFRHKTNKGAFLLRFTGVMLVHAIAVGWWIANRS